MWKPELSAAEAYRLLIEALCDLRAEDMALDLGIPKKECVDFLRQGVLEGRLLIDVDKAGDRVRLIPAPSLATD
jgi:hypothetical protein